MLERGTERRMAHGGHRGVTLTGAFVSWKTTSATCRGWRAAHLESGSIIIAHAAKASHRTGSDGVSAHHRGGPGRGPQPLVRAPALRLSFAALPTGIPLHQRLEVEGDLLGAHHAAQGKAPRLQFGRFRAGRIVRS